MMFDSSAGMFTGSADLEIARISRDELKFGSMLAMRRGYPCGSTSNGTDSENACATPP